MKYKINISSKGKKILLTGMPFFLIGTLLFIYWGGVKDEYIYLMPTPALYKINSTQGSKAEYPQKPEMGGMLYATNRQPSEIGNRFYGNSRGYVLRLGMAETTFGEKAKTWPELLNITMDQNRPSNYPLKVISVDEFGLLEKSVTALTKGFDLPREFPIGDIKFKEVINKQLSRSEQKDVTIFVHGYKVAFENPVLVASELWHYMKYKGVFIAFAWPSTPSTKAYFSDLETGDLSAANLRMLIKFLAQNTDAEKINLIGYSAGSRVVIQVLAQLALISQDKPKSWIARNYRIGRVIIPGSDMDRELFGIYLSEGLLRIPESMAVYTSEKDKALDLSRFLFGRDRLGHSWNQAKYSENLRLFHSSHSTLEIIDVTNAEGAETGNGHGYFRYSPWVSSDILTSLIRERSPEKRGLSRDPTTHIWFFPGNYLDKLWASELSPLESSQ